MSKMHQLCVQKCFSRALTAKVWVDNPPVAPTMDNTSGLPVVLALFPAGFHAARVKFSRLSIVSPPNPAHQSPTAGSVCLTTGNGDADTAKMARLNNDARSRVSMSKYVQSLE